MPPSFVGKQCFAICPDFIQSEHKSFCCEVFVAFVALLPRFFPSCNVVVMTWDLEVFVVSMHVKLMSFSLNVDLNHKTKQKNMVIIIAFGVCVFLLLLLCSCVLERIL